MRHFLRTTARLALAVAGLARRMIPLAVLRFLIALTSSSQRLTAGEQRTLALTVDLPSIADRADRNVALTTSTGEEPVIESRSCLPCRARQSHSISATLPTSGTLAARGKAQGDRQVF